ncbi:MAG TPA: LacI family DNA-binding transcriptional regulator [Candidatus Sulfomarinibacteraceae bacterium]|nr:LacI family DNA-binding transcriptional regulator [Candidatus Sulfomarinibacteraceae bacterium]
MTRVTLKDVAAKAGVSYQTVSKVLNNRAQVAPETEERIWAAVRELNYRPNVSARNLRKQASNLIGYAWHYTPDDFMHPVLDAFVHSVANAAEREGFHLLTFLATGEPPRPDVYQELFFRNQVAGFVLADTVTDDPRVKILMERDIPFVTFGRANDSWDFCWIDVDGRAGLRDAVKHLLGKGHRRIAFVTWPEGSQSGSYREQGYRDALQSRDIVPRDEWIIRGENAAELGRRAVRCLLALPREQRPTAIACVSDLVAIGAINAATAAGIVVGQDLAITGFDDIPLARYTQPPLTTVRQPIQEVGPEVVKLLLKQIRGDSAGQQQIILEPELIVRESG